MSDDETKAAARRVARRILISADLNPADYNLGMVPGSSVAIIDRLSSAPSRGSDSERAISDAEPLESWHDDDGPALWWKFPVVEPPYVGSPLDDDFPDYVTHWTRFTVPDSPLDAAPLVTESAGGQKP